MKEFFLLVGSQGVILSATAILGLFVVRKKKAALLLLSILAFSFIWRCISKFPSSRYYCIFIIYALLLSSFSARLLMRISKKAFYALIALIFSANILITFLTYNNIYILDLQDVIKDLSYRNPDDKIFVHSKERKRITFYEKKDTNEETELILNEVPEDLTFFYLKNTFFPNTLFCITPESFSRSLSSASKTQQTASDKRYARIGLLFKNKKHNSVISIYKHDPYTPHPVPDDGLDLLLEHCNLKAYVPEYDAFIYLNGSQLIWLIGCEEKLWVTFRLHFDSGEPPDHPPVSESDEERKWVDIGFTNNNSKQYEQIGKYHIFKRNIPEDIKFEFISCAFNSGKGTIRTRKFTVYEDAFSQPDQVESAKETESK